MAIGACTCCFGEPLVRPEPTDREGYVPNVVYTCGAMRHRDQIILYAVSDPAIAMADTVASLMVRGTPHLSSS